MAFRGLFVGIDRYQSPDIRDLSCAVRDATALEATFADTLGGQTVLLTDHDATLARVETEFEALSQCDPEDTVVIAFSGHGSETHELIVQDTGYDDIEATPFPFTSFRNGSRRYRRGASFCFWTAASQAASVRRSFRCQLFPAAWPPLKFDSKSWLAMAA